VKKYFKHIAVLLALIFSYPIVYQSVHAQNHAHSIMGCEHTHSHDNHSTYQLSQTPDNENCPICEYEFAISDLPIVAQETIKLPNHSDQHAFEITNPCISKNYRQTSPRAPPKS
jgi:hypothetical protein